MAEDDKKSDNFVGDLTSDKLAGIPIWIIGLVAVAGFFFVKSFLGGSSSSSTSQVPISTSPYPISGGGSSGSSGSSSTVSPTESPISSWVTSFQNAVGNLGISSSTSSSALDSYLAGQPITNPSQQTALQAVLAVVGNAPGIGSPNISTAQPTSTMTVEPMIPATSVSTNSGSQFITDLTNTLAHNVASGKTAPSESYFVQTAVNPAGNGALGLTNDGGVYTSGNTPFYGSLFTVGMGGANAAVGSTLKYNANGSYAITTKSGQTYNFGPGGVVQ